MTNRILFFALGMCAVGQTLGCDGKSGGATEAEADGSVDTGTDTGGVVDTDTGSVTETDSSTDSSPIASVSYPIVDSGQTSCYGNSASMTCPAAGAAFYGQDAQWMGNQPSYTISDDGLTVRDNVTGLTWQRSPDTNGDGAINASDKMTYDEAVTRPTAVNAAGYGGFDDWRLPTIKEQYSLILFSGLDPSGLTGTDTSSLIPFIDDTVFGYAYGDTTAGERIIDSQYASSNLYVDSTTAGNLLFGVNFADGRIKGYGLSMPGPGPGGTKEKTFFVTLVRGNPDYGVNDFEDNGDGTISDHATGLMWMRDDSGVGMNWQEALAFAQTKNDETFLGHSDWRLPNVKELQSILDYTRSPGTTGSAAIDPVFNATSIENEACEDDYPWYWSSTTHAQDNGSGGSGAYVCFGRALGYMNSGWVDIHGAGAQRSDPKGGDLSTKYTTQDCGYYFSIAPQGDAVRNSNFVRLVRDAASAGNSIGGESTADGERRDTGGEPDSGNTDSGSRSDTGPAACSEQADCEADSVCPAEASRGCTCADTPTGQACIPSCSKDEDCPQPQGMTLVCDALLNICVPQE